MLFYWVEVRGCFWTRRLLAPVILKVGTNLKEFSYMIIPFDWDEEDEKYFSE